MVTFNDLRITEDGKQLIIDVQVDSLSWYNNIYIESIHIDTDKTYTSDNAPSEKAYEAYTAEKGETLTGEGKAVSVLEATKILTIDEDGCMPVGTAETKSDCCGNVTTVKEDDTMLYKRHVTLTISASTLNTMLSTGSTLNNNMFFVYVICGGQVSSCTACGYDTMTDVGVVYNLKPLYDNGMGYINALADTCNVSMDFIDYILRYHAFQLCVDTGNYEEAIKYWQNYIVGTGSKTSTKIKGCGCHG